MTHQELVQPMLSMILGPETLVPVALSAGLFAVIGFFSVRALTRLPDFEHKAEMLWGARWCWAVWLGMCGAAWCVLYFGVAQTPYLGTSSLGSVACFWILFSVSLWFLEHQGMGAFFSVFVLRARLRGTEFDFAEWQEGKRKQRQKRRCYMIVVESALIMVVASYFYIILGLVYPVDRWTAEMARAERLGENIRRQLSSPSVEELIAFPPVPRNPRLFSAASVKQVLLSVQQILGVAPKPLLPTRREDFYHVSIRVTAETTQAEGEELVVRVQSTLAAAGEDNYWQIIVHSRDSHLSVEGSYPKG